MNNKFDISVLLPTRGRGQALGRSIRSLFELAENPSKIQLILGFDKDDTAGLDYWQQELQPWMDQQGHNYIAMKFDPMGYTRLHIYNNKMASYAQGRWFILWNDDAIVETQGWDTEIMKYGDDFKLLAFRTHQDHPYSIFPIMPRKWYDLIGYISPHPTQDGWVSQQAYLLNILERIPVWVKHDRYDLTGNNLDETFKGRQMLEGKPNDPADFHHVNQINLRHNDASKIADYLRNTLGKDMSFWNNIWKGTQDPWAQLKANDINGQMVQFAMDKTGHPIGNSIK